MAKEGTAFKVKKPKLAASVVEGATTQAQVAEAEGKEEAEEAEEVEEQPKPKRKLEQAVQAERPEGWVEFTCYETVDPAPTIGDFSFNRDLSVVVLEAKKTYTIPRRVAEVLVDKKKGVILP